jgi:soluble lytic murein transglycosylase-like protein
MNRPASALPASSDVPASPGRRNCLRWGTALGLGGVAGMAALTALTALSPTSALAQVGPGQLEEPLVDSVRTALTAAVRASEPMVPEFDTTEDYLQYARWKSSMADRLHSRKPDLRSRMEFLQTVWYETRRAGLPDVSLVLGLIQVESAFRKFAISPVGARGYMQIMPFWLRLIGDGDQDVGRLFHLQTNLRFGCVILRHYLDRERGDLFMALGRYNGSRGRATYPDLVFAAQRRWMMSA